MYTTEYGNESNNNVWDCYLSIEQEEYVHRKKRYVEENN